MTEVRGGDFTAREVKERSIRSAKWTFLSEIAVRVVQPVVTLVLARLVLPREFGKIGVAMVVISLAQVLQDLGLGRTLVQRERDVLQAANVVFWSSLGFSTLVYIGVYLASPAIAGYFKDVDLVPVLRVLCILIVLSSVITVPQSLLQREFRFKKVFSIRLASSVVPGLLSVPLAYLGFGVWALIAGTLAGSIAQGIIYWRVSDWRPSFDFNIEIARELLAFSRWVTLEALLGWIILCGDSIMLGHYLSMRDLGVYRVGSNLVAIAFGLLLNPILPVAYSAFSRIQSDKTEVYDLYIKMTKLISSVALPIGAGLCVLGKPISTAVFGERWSGIEEVVVYIGLMHSISWITGINAVVYTAIGRPAINSFVHILQLTWYLPVYVLTAPYGLRMFCIGRLIVCLISMILHVVIAWRVMSFGWLKLLKVIREPVLAALASLVAVYICRAFVEPANAIVDVIAYGTLFSGAYLLVLYLRDKIFLRSAYSLVRGAMG